MSFRLLSRATLFVGALAACVFSVTIWACTMPQVWGATAVENPIRNALLADVVFTTLAAILAYVHVRGRSQLKAKLSRLAFFLIFGGSLFLLGKALAEIGQRGSVREALPVNEYLTEYVRRHGRLPSEKELLEACSGTDWNRVRITLHGDRPGWRLDVKIRYVPWSSITYESDRGWFYRMD